MITGNFLISTNNIYRERMVMKYFKLVLVIALSCLVIFLAGCGSKEEQPVEKPEATPAETVAEAVDYTPTAEQLGTEFVCPVCGMKMKVAEDTPALVYEDEVYYFCNADEKAQFAANPVEFITKMKEEVMEEGAEKMDEATKKVKEATGH